MTKEEDKLHAECVDQVLKERDEERTLLAMMMIRPVIFDKSTLSERSFKYDINPCVYHIMDQLAASGTDLTPMNIGTYFLNELNEMASSIISTIDSIEIQKRIHARAE